MRLRPGRQPGQEAETAADAAFTYAAGRPGSATAWRYGQSFSGRAENQVGCSMPERSAGGCYIIAAQAGEPPGRSRGPDAVALGFAERQLVEWQPYELIYRQTDPRTGQHLGWAPGRYATFDDHLARLTAAEPHVTTERLLELEREAAQATRQSPAYTDLTVSFSRSISILHASIRENERRTQPRSRRPGQ